MHPVFVMELLMAAGVVMIAIIVVRLLPKRYRKSGWIIAIGLTLSIIAFFLLRPVWYEYQTAMNTEKLNQYLLQTYPGEDWKIEQRQTNSYNPYQLNVLFKNENGWVYTYFVKDEICQISWTIKSEKHRPSDGKHYTRAEQCNE